jgi:hypothetical protein
MRLTNVFIQPRAEDKLAWTMPRQGKGRMKSKICIGILYNFAPVHDQCEHYYLDKETGDTYMF